MKGKGYQAVFGPSPPEGMIGGGGLLGFIDLGVGAGTRKRMGHGHGWDHAKRAKNKARRRAIKAARRRRK